MMQTMFRTAALAAWFFCGATTAQTPAGPCPPQLQPPTQAQVQAAARAARDRGALWRITRDGSTSYLFGTVHVGKLEWTLPGPRLRSALAATDTIALEIDPTDPQMASRMAGTRGKAPPPSIPEALAERDTNFKNRMTPKITNDPTRFDSGDPELQCFRPGVPRANYMAYPFQIVQGTDSILMTYEFADAVRTVYLKDPGPAPANSWMGWNVGRWDGNTLVVDTINITPDSWWLDNLAHPKSDALHIVERFQRPNRDTLQIDFTFDDPKTYTRTWTGKKVFQLAPPGYEVLEDVVCEDLLDLDKKGRY